MSTENILVKLDVSNADNYFEFWREFYQHPKVNYGFFIPSHTPPDVMRERYDAYIKNPHASFFIFVDEENRPFGSCRVTFFEGVRSHVAMINAFGIHPDRHGKRLGSIMLAHVENWIKSHLAITQIELACDGDNIPALRLYENKGYNLTVIYHDWLHRPDFHKTLPWYTEMRCYVKSIIDEPYYTPLEITRISPMQHYSMCDVVVNSRGELPDIAEILLSYTTDEQQEIRKIISQDHQSTMVMKNQEGVVTALLCIRPYDEPRVSHAVTVPCVIFNQEMSDEEVASFIDAALRKYREQHDVFHFACSAEDTEDLFYTNGHSKIERLSSILQLAGFNFLGVVQNFFDKTSFAGRDLLAFECCFLNLEYASRCVNVSNDLSVVEKEKLNRVLDKFSASQEKFSRHEQWDIYLMVRYVAYPQCYTLGEIDQQIESCAERLVNYPECVELKDTLLGIVRKTPVKLDGFRSLDNQGPSERAVEVSQQPQAGFTFQ